MALLPQTAGMVSDPQRVLLELAGLHQLSELLPLAVHRLTESPLIALARIWMTLPPLARDCEACRLAGECRDRNECLHLVASAGRSIVDPQTDWGGLDGAFRRFPMGVRKVGKIAATGQSIEIADVSQDQSWAANPAWLSAEQITSFVGHPLLHRGKVLGVLGLFARTYPGESCFQWMRMIADHLAAAIANARSLDEIAALRSRLELENEYLREEVRESAAFGDLIGAAPALHAVTQQIQLVAPTTASVLILGESGTGKEVVAREIHRRSQRADRPLIKVNCAAVPRELYESEFFGHVKGAFTGALRDRAGRFELAHEGTIFLDEVGEIPLDLQAKLLRVLQEGEVERIGEERTRRVDVRVVAATNRNLRTEAEAGRFRQDLYYRLSVFPIELPPLRNRVEDIPLLAEHFLYRFARRLGRPLPRLTLANVQELQHYDWPGNVRELQHTLERACIVAVDGKLRFDLPPTSHKPRARSASVSTPDTILTDQEVRSLEADNIRKALARTSGKIYGPDGAAALLALKPTTLNSRIKALGIK